ncbi:MAG: D-glycerate dehydrogenase [Thermomicrobiales bacterium]
MGDKARVAVMRVIPDAGLNLLREAAQTGEIELEIWPHELPPNATELAGLLRGATGAVTLVSDRIDSAVLDAEPQLRVVSNFAVGYDNIDVDAATAHGVLVCNTPGVLTETTADMAWALLMAAGRRIVEASDYVRAGNWKTWGPTLLLGRDIHHATLGIIGLGRIGKEVAKRARGFDMEILAYDEYQDEAFAAEMGVTYTSLDELLQRSDFVTLHCALTPETYQLIGRDELAKMKPTAVLVNAARGPVVDTDALTDALRNGTIWAAGLDVTDPEPIPPDHPLVFMENVVIAPHIASASVDTRDKMAVMAATNLLQAIRGERPTHLVNPEVLG